MAIDVDRYKSRDIMDFKIMLMSDLRACTTKICVNRARKLLLEEFPEREMTIMECCNTRMKEVLAAYY